jgi:hypothetical protein
VQQEAALVEKHKATTGPPGVSLDAVSAPCANALSPLRPAAGRSAAAVGLGLAWPRVATAATDPPEQPIRSATAQVPSLCLASVSARWRCASETRRLPRRLIRYALPKSRYVGGQRWKIPALSANRFGMMGRSSQWLSESLRRWRNSVRTYL